MGIEKDTAFKYIGKDYRNILLELSNLPDDVDITDLEEVTLELENLKISQWRPDFILRNSSVIIMFEFESSYLTEQSIKRFLSYISLYHQKYNDESLDIYFIVITNKGKTEVISYKIGRIIQFDITVININELGFSETINSAKTKIKNKDVFSGEELVRLALTSLMPKTKLEIKNQFYWLSDQIDDINFEDEDARTSFIGIVLLLSNSYFGENDDIRKGLQRDFMNKVDCITERMEEIEKEATEANSIEIGIKMLEDNSPMDKVSKMVEIPIDRLKEEYDKYLREKHAPSV